MHQPAIDHDSNRVKPYINHWETQRDTHALPDPTSAAKGTKPHNLRLTLFYLLLCLSFPNCVSYISFLFTSKTAQPSAPPSHSILGGSLTSTRPPRPRKPRDSKPKMRKLKYHQYIPPDQRGGTGGGAGNTSQKNNNSQTPPTDTSYSHLLQQQQVFLQLQILNQQQLTVTNR